MTVTYKREMNHNYMIIDSPDRESGGYECKMLAGNGIEGLLKFRVRYQEEKKEFYYEITSKQPLKRLLEQKTISGEEIRALLLGIAGTLDRIEEYLLKEEQILMEPDYIYIEPDQFTVYLCMVPGYSCDFPAAFTALLKYLLGRVNHQDKDGVVLAYNLYHESLKDNYGMSDLLSYLREDRDSIFKEEKPGRDIGEEVPEPDKSEGQYEYLNWSDAQDLYEYSAQNEYPERTLRPKRDERPKRDGRSGIPGAPGKEREKGSGGGLDIRRMAAGLIKCAFCVAAGETLIWFLLGESGLYQYGAAGAIGIAAVVLAAGAFKNKNKAERGHNAEYKTGYTAEQNADHKTGREARHKTEYRAGYKPENGGRSEGRRSEEHRTEGRRIEERRNESAEKESWRIIFDEEREADSGRQADKKRVQEPETMLLTEGEKGKQTAVLESLSKERENIKISYVPFVIGKHEELTDYCLRQPTISRIHLRVDRKEGVYIVTDLNSTNGTTVEGYHLQANETVSIENGNTIYLADAGYRFLEGKA